MKTKELSEKMKNAYQNMVETIEVLIEKEGKTLKEAVEIAEEKQSNWIELTKEEAQKISAEVKRDLQSIGETFNGAKEAYKEQFKIDAEYLTESIWDKLSKVADVGTEEFLAFTADLKKRVNDIRSDEHLDEHKDHVQWSSDHEFWLDEIEIWRKDHQLALTKLKEIEQKIKKNADALEEHAQAIKVHEKLDHEHEEVLRESEVDPTSQVFESDENKESTFHQRERAEHIEHAKLHQSIKTDHRKIMASLNHLYKQVVGG